MIAGPCMMSKQLLFNSNLLTDEQTYSNPLLPNEVNQHVQTSEYEFCVIIWWSDWFQTTSSP